MDRLEEKLLGCALKNHKGETDETYIEEALRQLRILLNYMRKKYPNARAMHTVDSGIEITEEE